MIELNKQCHLQVSLHQDNNKAHYTQLILKKYPLEKRIEIMVKP